MNVAIYMNRGQVLGVCGHYLQINVAIYMNRGHSIYEQGATTGVALCVSRAEKDLRGGPGQREGLLVSLG